MIEEMGFKKAQKTIRDMYNYHAAIRHGRLDSYIADKVKKEVNHLNGKATDEELAVEGVQEKFQQQAELTTQKIIDYLDDVSGDIDKMREIIKAFDDHFDHDKAKGWSDKARFNTNMFTGVPYFVEQMQRYDMTILHSRVLPNSWNYISELDYYD